MKRIFLLVVLVLILTPLLSMNEDLTIISQNDETTTILFQQSGFNLEKVVTVEGIFSKINSEYPVEINEKGLAKLPYISLGMKYNSGSNFEIEMKNAEYEIINLENQIIPSRGPILRNQNPDDFPFTYDNAKIQDGFYPESIIKENSNFQIRDLRGKTFYLYPFQYDYNNNVLKVLKSAEFQITELGFEAKSNKISPEFIPTYSKIFLNFSNSRDLIVADRGELLIIFTNEDLEAVNLYKEWKMKKGLTIHLLQVEPNTNVKSSIQEYYNANNNIAFIQIFGDWDKIKSDTNGVVAGAPMDPMLGCVVGTDNFQDIAVGRFSTDSSGILAQVNKTIKYEREPLENGLWYKKAMGIASDEGPGDDDEYDAVHMNVIRDNKLLANSFDEVYQVYDPGATSAQVTANVNAGLSLINYVGHGLSDRWWTTGFTGNNADALTNDFMNPFIISVACLNGTFHQGTSFAEHWMNNVDSGAIAMVAATISQPWAPPMRGQDYMNDLMSGGYDYVVNPGNGTSTTEGTHIAGSVVANALNLMYAESNSSSDLETIQTWILFGDVTLELRNDTPKVVSLENVNSEISTDFVATTMVDGIATKGVTIAIERDGNIYSGISNESGVVTIAHEFTEGNVNVIVTGKNLLTLESIIEIRGSSVGLSNFDQLELSHYPNPFHLSNSRSTSTISYNLAKESDVNLTIYNILGQKIINVKNENQTKGKHSISWNGKDSKNRNVAAGIYFYKLKTNHGSKTKRMMIIK